MPEPKSPDQRRRPAPRSEFSDHDRTEVMAAPQAISRVAEGSGGSRPRRKVPEPASTNVIPFVGRMPPPPRTSAPMPGVAPVQAKVAAPAPSRAVGGLPALPQAAPLQPARKFEPAAPAPAATATAAAATARKLEPPLPQPEPSRPQAQPVEKKPQRASSSLPAVFLPAPANSDQTIQTKAVPEAPAPSPVPAQQSVVARMPLGRRTLAERWAIFEQLGLGPKPGEQRNTAKMLVTTYRALGFVVLSIIVVVLVAYIATAAFYFVSDSWIQPMVVSRSDEKVLALEAQVAEQETIRERIIADLAQADRNIELQQNFQSQFVEAVRADLEGRKAALTRVRKLAQGYEGTRKKIESSNAAYASESRRRLKKEYAAGMIDRSDMLDGKFQLAQISGSNLSLAERQAEYETRAEELESEAAGLEELLDDQSGEQVLSYEVLQIKQDYEKSRLEALKAIEDREALQSALVRQDEVLAGLRSSPYLRALHDEAQVAFVPYDNLHNLGPGTGLYSCKLEMVFCHKVGRVIEVLPGEISFKHPHREKVLRGQLVELDLDEDAAAEKDVLFVGGRPLFL